MYFELSIISQEYPEISIVSQQKYFKKISIMSQKLKKD